MNIRIRNVDRFCELVAHRCVNGPMRTVLVAALDTMTGLISQEFPVTIQLQDNRGVASAPTFPALAVGLGDIGRKRRAERVEQEACDFVPDPLGLRFSVVQAHAVQGADKSQAPLLGSGSIRDLDERSQLERRGCGWAAAVWTEL